MNMKSGWVHNIPSPKKESDIQRRENAIRAEIQIIKNFCIKHGMSIVDDMPGTKKEIMFFMDDTRASSENALDFGEILEKVYQLLEGFEKDIRLTVQTANPDEFSLDSHIDKFILKRVV